MGLRIEVVVCPGTARGYPSAERVEEPEDAGEFDELELRSLGVEEDRGRGLLPTFTHGQPKEATTEPLVDDQVGPCVEPVPRFADLLAESIGWRPRISESPGGRSARRDEEPERRVRDPRSTPWCRVQQHHSPARPEEVDPTGHRSSRISQEADDERGEHGVR